MVVRWEMPEAPDALRSPVPMGVVQFEGSEPIAVKGTNDETNYKLVTVLPGGFAYLIKSATVAFVSDDLVNDFGNFGVMRYLLNTAGITYAFDAPGESFLGNAAKAARIYSISRGSAKLMLQPDAGHTIDFRLTDMSADASTAGDVNYFIEFYQYAIGQVTKWEVNTPLPTLSHTSF